MEKIADYHFKRYHISIHFPDCGQFLQILDITIHGLDDTKRIFIVLIK